MRQLPPIQVISHEFSPTSETVLNLKPPEAENIFQGYTFVNALPSLNEQPQVTSGWTWQNVVPILAMCNAHEQ